MAFQDLGAGGTGSASNLLGLDLSTSITTNQLPVGPNQTITASYSGDGGFAPNTGTVSQTVKLAGTTTKLATSNANPPVNDQSTVFTATVSGAGQAVPPSGFVAFYSTYQYNGQFFTAFLGYGINQGNGVWTFNPTTDRYSGPDPLFWSTPGAVYTITAHFYEDDNYFGSDSNGVQETVQGGGRG